jgi:transcriptional regulator with PAS, ATPase and Fis domain
MALLLEKSKTLHEVLLRLVHDTLKRNDGNKTRAAKELGVTVRCVRNWIAKFDELSEFRNARVK